MDGDFKEILGKNRAVSKYLGCVSVEGIISTLETVANVDKNSLKMSMKQYSVGALFCTQSQVTPDIAEKIEKGVWDAKSNEYFKKGQEVDFSEEPIVVASSGSGSRKYIIAGHTRAKHKYQTQGVDAMVNSIYLEHPNVEKYVDQVTRTIGIKKVKDF